MDLLGIKSGGGGWVRQSGRRVEQKVCRDGDNEMSNNGASTLPKLKINPIEIWCFIFIGL